MYSFFEGYMEYFTAKTFEIKWILFEKKLFKNFSKRRIYVTTANYIYVNYENRKQFFLQGDAGDTSQWAFTCSKLTIETLEQGVKYVQS